jgi:hypothetical protein
MSLPTAAEVFRRMIDDLESAASCARQLCFLRGQNEWLAIDERILTMRKLIISLAEAKERQNMSKGIYLP